MSFNNCHNVILKEMNLLFRSQCEETCQNKCVNATYTTDADFTCNSLTLIHASHTGLVCVQGAYLEGERSSSGGPFPCSFFTSISLLLRSTSLIFPREPPLCRAPLPSFKHTPALVYYIYTYSHTHPSAKLHILFISHTPVTLIWTPVHLLIHANYPISQSSGSNIMHKIMHHTSQELQLR